MGYYQCDEVDRAVELYAKICRQEDPDAQVPAPYRDTSWKEGKHLVVLRNATDVLARFLICEDGQLRWIQPQRTV